MEWPMCENEHSPGQVGIMFPDHSRQEFRCFDCDSTISFRAQGMKIKRRINYK